MLLAGPVMADSITIQVSPDQVPDESPPRVNVGDAPTGFGSESWQNADTGKVNWHARYLADGNALSALFPTEAATLTIGDLASIDYWTKRPSGTAAGEEWAVFIYTRPDGVNDASSWYGYRFLNNYNEHTETDAWTQYSTSSGMTFRDNAGNAGGVSGDLAYLKANFGSELVEMISIQTMSNYADFNGYVDGLTITLDSGSVGSVNLIPEPATMGLLGLGLAGVIARRRKQRT
jgi:hypothetical protein